MAFDPLVANAGRLRILTALAVEERQEFVQLRRATQLTDGNLAAHARRLQTAGFIAVDKQFRQGKPVTSFVLTGEGRRALETHTRRLVAAISQRRLVPTAASGSFPQPEPEPAAPAPTSIKPAPDITIDEEWVD